MQIFIKYSRDKISLKNVVENFYKNFTKFHDIFRCTYYVTIYNLTCLVSRFNIAAFVLKALLKFISS